MGVDTPDEKLAKNKSGGFTPTITPPAGEVPSLSDLANTAVSQVKAGDPDPRLKGTNQGAQQRLAKELAGLAPDSIEYDNAVLALQLDWSDPAYAVALLKLKVAAKSRQKNRVSPGVVHGMTAEEISMGKAARDAEAKKAQDAESQAWADKINAGMANPKLEQVGGNDGTRAPGMRPEDAAATDEFKRQNKGKPIIRGLPVDAGTVLGESSTASGDAGGSGLSEWIRQWATKQGLDVTYEDAQEASATGNFVYVGQEEDKRGGPGYMRDVYVYKDDAASGVANMSVEDIASYQSQLGLEVIGIVDPKLQALWEKAVEIGTQYARAGKKVELKFIFDTLVASAVAGGGLGSGGGGGGGSTKADTDYYFAMMQVLGDISGVKG
jgi:hypothetical protein